MIHSANAVILVGGKYAMQLRDLNAPTDPGRWGLFGGGIEPGESSLHALFRELREELELDVARADYLGDVGPCRYFVVDATGQWHRHVLHEGQEARLFTEDELLAMPLNEFTRAAIDAHRMRR